MNNFIFSQPTKIYFGKGQIQNLSHELKPRAKKILIVTGRGSVKKYSLWPDVISQIKKSGVKWVELAGVYPNPHLREVYQGIDLCRKEKIDCILAVGGGSVIDTAKAISAGVLYKGDVWDFFAYDAVVQKTVPLGVILTLAAAGSEMNGNMVITKKETEQKLVSGSASLCPVFSILDPCYTMSVGPYQSAAGVVDIMVHVFEQYFSLTPHTAVSDYLAEALMKVCIEYGPVVYKNPKDYNARSQIMWTSSLALNGLIALGKESDWATHYIEHEISAIYDVPHGVGLAVLSPCWMRHVLNKKTVARFVRYGENVWGLKRKKDPFTFAQCAIEKTRQFFSSLGMPTRLKDIHIGKERIQEMAQKTIKHNPRLGSFQRLHQKDVAAILTQAL